MGDNEKKVHELVVKRRKSHRHSMAYDLGKRRSVIDKKDGNKSSKDILRRDKELVEEKDKENKEKEREDKLKKDIFIIKEEKEEKEVKRRESKNYESKGLKSSHKEKDERDFKKDKDEKDPKRDKDDKEKEEKDREVKRDKVQEKEEREIKKEKDEKEVKKEERELKRESKKDRDKEEKEIKRNSKKDSGNKSLLLVDHRDEKEVLFKKDKDSDRDERDSSRRDTEKDEKERDKKDKKEKDKKDGNREREAVGLKRKSKKRTSNAKKEKKKSKSLATKKAASRRRINSAPDSVSSSESEKELKKYNFRRMTVTEEKERLRLAEERRSSTRRGLAFYKKDMSFDSSQSMEPPPKSSSACISGNYKDDSRFKFDVKPTDLLLSFADTQGRRPSMEDNLFAYFVSENTYIFGLCDGHNGNETSKFVSENLATTIGSLLGIYSDEKQAIYKAFQRVNRRLKHKEIPGGSTVVCIVFRKDQIYVANIGDSRCILCHNEEKNKPIQITTDHKPNDPKERSRIEALGGKIVEMVTPTGQMISRINGLLSVSRSLGDFELHPLVGQEPDIFVLQKTKHFDRDQYIVAACDGIWDVLSNEEVERIVSTYLKMSPDDIEGACIRLRDYAYLKGSLDNITVMIAKGIRV